MRSQYRSRVQFLTELKRVLLVNLADLKHDAKRTGWWYRVLTVRSRMDEEVTYRGLLHAVEMALLKAGRHYRWEYTATSKVNPFKFPDDIEVKNIRYGLIFETTETTSVKYTAFMK